MLCFGGLELLFEAKDLLSPHLFVDILQFDYFALQLQVFNL